MQQQWRKTRIPLFLFVAAHFLFSFCSLYSLVPSASSADAITPAGPGSLSSEALRGEMEGRKEKRKPPSVSLRSALSRRRRCQGKKGRCGARAYGLQGNRSARMRVDVSAGARCVSRCGLLARIERRRLQQRCFWKRGDMRINR